MLDEILYIVMPAYNEVANIQTVVEQWYPILDGKNERSRLVVADSGSTDGTHELLEQLRSSYSKLEILSNSDKYHGPKLMALYRHAIDAGADYIFQTDSDGQTNPDEFASFWNERSQCEGIIGYRVAREDGKGRAFVEAIVCLLVRLFFGVRIPDANAPFRLMRTSLIEKYIDLLPADYNIPNIMFTSIFAFFEEKICFEEISFKPRQGGENSINYLKIIRIGCKALKDFSKYSKECKKRKKDKYD